MFDKVVFAGGGHRCWWQAGFWDVVTGEIELYPRVIGAVSAGAATVCLLYANDARRALAWYERELAGVRSNVNWLNLFRRGEPLFPHAAIYRKALRALLGGDAFRQLMWRAPEIRVAYSRLPPGVKPWRAVMGGLVAYNVEKYGKRALHPQAGRRRGFTTEFRRVQDCRSDRELVDLLVASSCTPPFTPLELVDGEPCLDGGLVDNVPVDIVAEVPGQTLVLTTRRYPERTPVFAHDGRLYVQPSEAVAASSWDYTSPAKYLKTYDLGRRDADRFLQTFGLGSHRDPDRFAGLFLEELAPAGVALAGGSAVDEAMAREDGQGADGDEAAGREANGREAVGPAAVGPAAVEPDAVAGDVHGAVSQDDVAQEGGAAARGVADDRRVDPADEMRAIDPDDEPDDIDRDVDPTTPLRAMIAARGAALPSARAGADRQGADTSVGTAEAFNASQPAASDGQLRSGRSFKASRI